MKKILVAAISVLLCAVSVAYGQSRKDLLKSAKKGDAEAQYKLGYCYEYGMKIYPEFLKERVKPNLKKAEKWYLEAAKQNYPIAYYSLGNVYAKNLEYGNATLWYKRAVDSGNEDAALSAAKMENKRYAHDQAAKWYIKAIDMGERIAIEYLMSLETPDYSYRHMEREELLQLAEQRDTKAQCALAFCYYTGKGHFYGTSKDTDINYVKAKKWYLEAAAIGERSAYFPLAVMYQYVLYNNDEAIKWYKRAANKSFKYDSDAFVEAAPVCLAELGVKYTPVILPEDSIENLLKKAKQGDAEAWYQLGYCLRWGKAYYSGKDDEIPKNYDKAKECYLKAIDSGYDRAYFYLGSLYQYGLKNKEEAIKWYKKEAEINNNEVAIKCIEELLAGDKEDSRTKLLEQAEADDAEAWYKLGNCYEEGKAYYSGKVGEIPSDYDKAKECYLKAADGGYDRAYFSLALLYQYDLKDKYEAIKWYKKYADNGSKVAIESLAELGVNYTPGGTSSSYTSSSGSSSSRSSSSGSRSSRTPDGLLAEGTYTISAQGRSTTTGQYTGVAGPDMKVEVKFYDDRITVNGYTYKYESTENGWKKYKGNVIKFGTGSTYTTYYVDSRYNMRRVDCSSFSYGMFGSTDWFTYDVVKGEVNIPDVYSPYGGGSYSTGSSSSESSSGSSYGSSRHQCSLCHGTGRIVRETPTGTFGTGDYKKKCDECGQYFYMSTGHSHVTCPQCHGKGYFTTD